MSLIFRLQHEGETLAYLHEPWGTRRDGVFLKRRVRVAARTYNLDLTKRADAIQAVRIAGEEEYGHAKWTANAVDTDDADEVLATTEDRAYLMAHRNDIIADNKYEQGLVFYYGTYENYPAYIEGWCDYSYTMTV